MGRSCFNTCFVAVKFLVAVCQKRVDFKAIIMDLKTEFSSQLENKMKNIHGLKKPNPLKGKKEKHMDLGFGCLHPVNAMLSHFSHVWPSVTLRPIAHQAPQSMDSPGKNTGVGCHAIFQGIFLIKGMNAHLLHCRQILYR